MVMIIMHNNNSSECLTACECNDCDMTRRRSVQAIFSTHFGLDKSHKTHHQNGGGIQNGGCVQNGGGVQNGVHNGGKDMTSAEVPSTNNVDLESAKKDECQSSVPKRWVLAFALCFMRMCHAALRQDIGFALVCMSSINNPAGVTSRDSNLTSDSNETSVVFPMSSDSRRAVAISENSTEFSWSSVFEGQVLSAPYYGFLLVIPFAGYLDHALGSRRLLVLSLLVGGSLSILTPTLTRQHHYLLVILRAITGASNAVVKAAVFSLFANWTPVPERGVLTAVEYTGSALGGILTFFVSGFLCSIPLDGGWPFVFYVFGAVSLLCAGVLALTVHDTPTQHPSINSAEIAFITNNLAHEAQKGPVRPPWAKMLKCPAVWAIVIANVCHHWVFAAIVGYLPMYMKDVLNFTIEENGMLSALPFVGSLIIGLVGGVLVDRMQRCMQTVYVRKTFQLTGSIGFAVPMFVVSWLDASQRIFAVILLIGAVTLLNLTSLAFRINSLDIAPGYASHVTSLSFTVATAVSLTAPLVTSEILQNKSDEEWQKVLFIVTAVSLFGGIFYVIFARGDVQPWACEHTYDVTVVPSGTITFRRANSVPDDFRAHKEELSGPDQCVVLSVTRLEDGLS